MLLRLGLEGLVTMSLEHDAKPPGTIRVTRLYFQSLVSFPCPSLDTPRLGVCRVQTLNLWIIVFQDFPTAIRELAEPGGDSTIVADGPLPP